MLGFFPTEHKWPFLLTQGNLIHGLKVLCRIVNHDQHSAQFLCKLLIAANKRTKTEMVQCFHVKHSAACLQSPVLHIRASYWNPTKHNECWERSTQHLPLTCWSQETLLFLKYILFVCEDQVSSPHSCMHCGTSDTCIFLCGCQHYLHKLSRYVQPQMQRQFLKGLDQRLAVNGKCR